MSRSVDIARALTYRDIDLVFLVLKGSLCAEAV